MQKEIDVRDSSNVVDLSNVVDSSQQLCSDKLSSLDVKAQTSLPIHHDNLLFNSTEKTYTILESENITKRCQIYTNENRNLICYFTGLINKIVLDDFPLNSTYILSVNGQNVDTAHVDFIYGVQMFDFTKEKKSDMLEVFIDVSKSDDEPELSDRMNYINFNRIDNIRINVPKKLKLNNVHHLTLYGYFLNNGKWINSIRKYQLYTNGLIRINACQPTYSIKLMRNTIKYQNSKFIIQINDMTFGPFILEEYINLLFQNPKGFLIGLQNIHLNEIQNFNSINLSKVDYLTIIFIDNPEIVSNIEIIQNLFVIRDKQYLMHVYCN